MKKLSVIIPTYNEGENFYYTQTLKLLQRYQQDIEIIVSDGGSEDQTLSLAKKYHAKIIKSDSNSRSVRLSEGIEHSTGEMVLLNHPRSLLTEDGIEFLIKNVKQLSWGGFSHRFDYKHWLLKFTSWYSNTIRSKASGILYLDHCIFIARGLAKKVSPLPAVDIFEDTILSQRLKKLAGRPTVLPFPSITSAVRFQKNGIFRQAVLNQYLKIQFHQGQNHKNMNSLYERNVGLNTDYDKKNKT